MGKQNDVGVFQLENGKWAFRYTFTKNGKRSSKRSCKDEFGNSLNTKRAAIKARQIAVDAEALNQPLKPVERKTVIFFCSENYCVLCKCLCYLCFCFADHFNYHFCHCFNLLCVLFFLCFPCSLCT